MASNMTAQKETDWVKRMAKALGHAQKNCPKHRELRKALSKWSNLQ